MVKLEGEVLWSLIVHILGMLYIIMMTLNLFDFVFTAIVCFWYFGVENQRYRRGFRLAFLYHPGSVMIGALWICISWTVRIIHQYFDTKWQIEGHRNYLVQCLGTFLAVFERGIAMVNRNVYAQICLYGTPYFTSLSNGGAILYRHLARVTVIDIFGILGKIFVMLVTLVLGYCNMLLFYDDIGKDISNTVLVIITVAVIGYVVGDTIAKVYDVALDTIMQCFLADDEASMEHQMPPRKIVPEVMRKYLRIYDQKAKEQKED
eukprot:TRINITY_DN1504_c0_g1_i10.p1 TRINITY_DN1504_c0_g1~~TRINITY_DN1504_c0_g1_i10.p1  ORF type:complete len:262 (+),score=21.13 TRINITY_DN1504_c0_g1_i10:132-917(+)